MKIGQLQGLDVGTVLKYGSVLGLQQCTSRLTGKIISSHIAPIKAQVTNVVQ